MAVVHHTYCDDVIFLPPSGKCTRQRGQPNCWMIPQAPRPSLPSLTPLPQTPGYTCAPPLFPLYLGPTQTPLLRSVKVWLVCCYDYQPLQERCLAVYRDLWQRGYTLTSGLKYGADYLVYQGDPTLVHSCYLALVLAWQQTIPSVQSLCRVASKVGKAILLCCVEGGHVQYQTMRWGLSTTTTLNN